MAAETTTWLPYAKVRERMNRHPLRVAEIPTESSVSLPLPTLRWQAPGYLFFASPLGRQPGQPARQAPPGRWWVIDARSGRLVVYARFTALPYADGVDWTTQTLPPETRSIAEIQETLSSLEGVLDALAPAFFAGQSAVSRARRAVLELLAQQIPAPVVPWYHAATPDFFEWLEA